MPDTIYSLLGVWPFHFFSVEILFGGYSCQLPPPTNDVIVSSLIFSLIIMHSFSEGSEFRSLSPTSSDLVLILLSHVPWAGILRPDLQMGNLRLREGEEQRGVSYTARRRM